jgi:arsenite-transporting ATPase
VLREVITGNNGQGRYIFFSGKGGVGKTTVSAATAVWLAEHGYKTLLLSTDIQLSLDDIFQQKISSKGTQITGISNLTAISINAAESMQRYREKMLKTLKIIDPDSYILKQVDTDSKLDCGAAQAAVFELSYYLNNKDYDCIIFDTAPTGMHMEKIIAQSKYVLAMTSQIEARKKMSQELGESIVEEEIHALEEIKRMDEEAIETLRSDSTSFVMVLIPEAMPLAELERNIPVLEDVYRIPVRAIVINRVIPEGERERDSFWRARWSMQKKYIQIVREKFQQKKIGEAVLIPEVAGIEMLRMVGEKLYGK